MFITMCDDSYYKVLQLILSQSGLDLVTRGDNFLLQSATIITKYKRTIVYIPCFRHASGKYLKMERGALHFSCAFFKANDNLMIQFHQYHPPRLDLAIRG